MLIHRCVGAVIVRAGAILLGLRAPGRSFCPDVWDVFGGHVEPSERIEHCLVRELREELGITPTYWAYLETIEEVDPARDEVVQCHFYLVSAWRGEPRNLQPAEHSAIQWLSLDQVAQLPLAHPRYPQLFARALQAQL